MTRFLRLLPLFVATACGAADQQPAEPDQTKPTYTAPAVVAERPEFVGVVTARNSQVITAAFAGRVKTLSITPNQPVHAGDPIAKLDDTDLRSQIAGYLAEEKSARSEAGASGAQAAQAKQEAGMAEHSFKNGGGARVAIGQKQAEAAADGARAGAAMARGEISKTKRDVAERQLAQAEIKAPIDGIVMMVKAKVGEITQQGAPIARIYDPRDLLIRFAVPKEYRSLVKKGVRVELRIEGVERAIWATIDRTADEEAPINITVVEADIDDSKLAPDEVRVASLGHVRIADAHGGSR